MDYPRRALWRFAAVAGSAHRHDASVALLAVIALFIARDREGDALITWEQASQIPWGVLLYSAAVSVWRVRLLPRFECAGGRCHDIGHRSACLCHDAAAGALCDISYRGDL